MSNNNFLVLCSASFWSALLLLTANSDAAPLTLAQTQSARTIHTHSASLMERSLAFACLGIENLSDGSTCNPALNTFIEEPRLELRGVLASGYSNLQEVLKLTKNPVSQSTIDRLFEDENFLLESEVDTELSFRSRWATFGYRPIFASGIIVARNEANPDIELKASKAQSFYAQSGMNLFKGFNVGLRLSITKLEGVSGRFRLIDGNPPLPIKETRLYVEPGLSYELPLEWKTRVSFFLARLGYRSSTRIDDLDTPLSPEWALTVSPPLYWGDLDLSLEFRDMEGGMTAAERLRFGALYKLGSMAVSSGIDSAGLSVGVFALIEKLGAGIMYSTNNVFWRSADAFTQTMYSQIMWSF